jgi:5-aminopentanamidase
LTIGVLRLVLGDVMDKVKLAAVQMNPCLMKKNENLSYILGALERAAGEKASLVVFPECALTGYVFQSLDEAMPFAETIPGPSTERVAARCRELGVYAIYGLLERDASRLFNAAAFVGPEGLISGYRKNHLPFLGVDRFTSKGDRPFTVRETPIGRIGLFICYDIVFPESARVMALAGADILVLPTAFPQVRRETLATYIVPARAIENRVHVVAADRVGSERGYSFAGLSKIVSASGNILATASPDGEEIIYGEVSRESARHKHHVITPGEYEVDYFGDRRPELYGGIVGPEGP